MFGYPLWLALLSPSALLETTIEPATFPDGARYWNRIGAYKLKDGHAERWVLLYYSDSEKTFEMMTGTPVRMVPNSLNVHALHQNDKGKWTHAELFGYSRRRFSKVVKTTPNAVILEVGGNWPIRIDFNGDWKAQLELAQRVNAPFVETISFKDGRLVAK